MGKTYRDRSNKPWARDRKQSRLRKQEKAWNEKNTRHFQQEKYSPFDDSQEHHEQFA